MVDRKVTVRPMGQKAKTVTVPSNAKVKDILAKAGVEYGTGVKIIANGDEVTASSTMPKKHRELLVIPTVKGGA